MNKDLKYIKKHYSEKLSHVCRELFPTLLEVPGLLPQVLDKKFDRTASLGEVLTNEDARQEFKDFIFAQVDVEKPQPEMLGAKDAVALMAEAGYKLYPECLTEADIQSFRWLYHRSTPTPVYTGGQPEQRSGEEICTFNGGRLNRCRVWFAVKEGAEDLRREDFTSPTRQDEYGTSVISIQFTKQGTPTLSIKNRYNHTVNNPDATFGNNLDNIIPGLTQAWAETFSMSLFSAEEVRFNLGDFRLGSDGRYYKMNCQDSRGTIYCENNVILDHGQTVKLGTDYMLLDNNIFDLKNNRVISYQTYKTETMGVQEDADQYYTPPFEDDAFISSLGDISKIEVVKGEGKERILLIKTSAGEDVRITTSRHNEILEVHDPNSTEIRNGYLSLSNHIRSFSAPQAVTIGNNVICRSSSLSSLNIPNVETIGDHFTAYATLLQRLDVPKLRELGSHSFSSTLISELNVPNLEKIGDGSFGTFNSINVLGRDFVNVVREDGQEEALLNNPAAFFTAALGEAGEDDREMIKNLQPFSLQTFNAPKLTEIGAGCFVENEIIEFNAPALQVVGQNCFKKAQIGTFNCGIPIEPSKPFLETEEDKVLFSACVGAIVEVQREMLGVKTQTAESTLTTEVAPTPVETTTPAQPLPSDSTSAGTEIVQE